MARRTGGLAWMLRRGEGAPPPFWAYASLMLRRRWTAVAAVAFAFIAAINLGVGVLGLVPVLRLITGEEDRGLRERVTGWLDANGLPAPAGLIGLLPNEPFKTVVVIIVGLGLLTIIGATANFLHAYFSMNLSVETVATLRRRAFHRLLHAPLGEIVSGRSGDLISRVVSDTNALGRGFTALTSKAVAGVTRGAATLVAAFIINWRLSLVTMAVAPLLAFIIRKLGKRIRRASRGAMEGQAEMLAVAGEAMHGFRVVKVHAAERYEIGRFSRLNRNVVRQQLRARTARALSAPLMEVVVIITLGSLSVVAVRAIMTGDLSMASFVGALGALAFAGNALKPLSNVLQSIHSAEAAAERLAHVLGLPMEDDQRERRKPALPRLAESLEFDRVTFAYTADDAPALRDVSLRLRHGETTAFVGPNGSGKTTLLSLIPRLFEPTHGRVLFDGRDIAGYAARSLRRQIGVVTQEVVLFRGTVADNIAYAQPDATHEQIVAAARRARAHDFIMETPEGYGTVIGDQGLTLSGGQRQRIAIARAVLRDPAVLIMDEATSMIDAESEAHISAAVADFSQGRTCLIVAHRLSTVIHVDRIVVMAEGRVVDEGRHDELLDRCALYRQLVKHQLAPARQPALAEADDDAVAPR